MVNSTRLQLGALFTPSSVEQAIVNLRNVLRNNGFPQTRIEPNTSTIRQRSRLLSIFGSRPMARAICPSADHREPGTAGRGNRRDDALEGLAGLEEGHRVADRGRRRPGAQLLPEAPTAWRPGLDRQDGLDRQTNLTRPSLNVQGGPTIEFTTLGAKVSRGKLKQLVPVFEEQAVDRDLLVEGANNLREYIESQGYFDAKVDFASKSRARPPGHRVPRRPRRAAQGGAGGHSVATAHSRRHTPRAHVSPQASRLEFRHGRFSDEFPAPGRGGDYGPVPRERVSRGRSEDASRP